MDGHKILMRELDNSKIYAINSQNDLNKLKTQYCNKIKYPQSQQNVRNLSNLNNNNTQFT